MKKTFYSWLLCLVMASILPLCFVSCSSDDDKSLDLNLDYLGAQKDCRITINGELYYADALAELSYHTDNHRCFGYDDRPMYSQYQLCPLPDYDIYNRSKLMTIIVHIPNFAKGFEFSSENTSLFDFRKDDAYLLTSGSAKVISFDKKTCVTEFKDCVFKNVSVDSTIKIDGRLKCDVKVCKKE